MNYTVARVQCLGSISSLICNVLYTRVGCLTVKMIFSLNWKTIFESLRLFIAV